MPLTHIQTKRHHHKFHPHGFHLSEHSKLGAAEPLTTVRIMQSRLKGIAIKCRFGEREIKVSNKTSP
jgi:hypothetical protein